ncbi:MAG: GT4 family glycosyltransferase PelF [Candidatus Omnitrophica bacterium]|nr:GT4 family glycosyltransferase PelF [Candidatus Omnitrophota bacterium]MDD5653482.1 GT4 family glycosyltransferase PelF [Candidatus Omnitrophota bacterium]
MADVCLLLEGTFPYVSGGVSTWIYDLIRQMDDISFAICYLGPHRLAHKKMHYEIPDNVTDFQEIYIFDYEIAKKARRPQISQKDMKVIEDFLLHMRKNDPAYFDSFARLLNGKSIDLYDLAFSFDSWKIILDIYEAEGEEPSFIDYFWTWRFVYLPLFSLLKSNLPEAKLYHSVSTGYAGVLGALAKLKYQRPFMLTEHGIYTRERKIEISQAEWIYSETANEIKVTEANDFFKEWWMGLFSFFSRLAYNRADEIISLFEGNRKIQIEEGAPVSRTRIIPNGVDVGLFRDIKKTPPDGIFRIGFMGRVVPIKDVKTFIRACKIIFMQMKNIEIYIMGPTDEDEEYYKECVLLAQREGLEQVIKFCGKVDIYEYYPKLDVIVLTSISEGQPIVVLEAGICGIPVVATNVGACEELLYGATPDDRLLGKSGEITLPYDPQATADAVMRMLKNSEAHARMAAAGKKRVNLYYQMDDLIANYRLLYAKYMQEAKWQG